MNKGKLIMDIPLAVPAGHCNSNKVIYLKKDREKMFSSEYFKALTNAGLVYLYDYRYITNTANMLIYGMPINAKIGRVLSFDDYKATVLFDDPDYIENLPDDISNYAISLNVIGISNKCKVCGLTINYITNMKFSSFILIKKWNNPYINITEDMIKY